MMLKNKKILIAGIANKHSIAAGIAKSMHAQGAKLAFTYQSERLKDNVKKISSELGSNLLFECDVASDESISQMFNNLSKEWGSFDGFVHSIGFAPANELEGNFVVASSREGFQIAHDISSYSFTALAKAFKNDLNEAASLVTLSYIGSNKVVQNYNVMGVAKASLESSVLYLADSLGDKRIRVNAVSAGPIKTLAAAGISGFNKILDVYQEKSAIKDNVTTDDVAKVVYFLLSDYSNAVTGQTIYVDNGFNIICY